jgi:superfamily II DNA or RNA helicase
MTTSPFSSLRFRQPFWHYQELILDVVERQQDKDRKYHIVAPPGSGKTIVGLELVRRFERPAVVFCPTTTIQQQWQEKAGLFTDDPEWVAAHVSMDATRLTDLNVMTYQILSTPGENLDFVERIAVERWVEDLVQDGKAETVAAAQERVATLHASNAAAYRREVSKRYRRLKREFLRGGEFDGRRFLHPNARDLISRLVALGTGTVVLDECHHLLDYWAFILRELIAELPDVRVVGLTATLPDPSNESEYDNYYSLLGEIDFEVPTPAVVKEGHLAPYRDLVYFCEPSRREMEYLRHIQEHFQAAIARVTEAEAFAEWLEQLIIVRRPAADPKAESPVPVEATEDSPLQEPEGNSTSASTASSQAPEPFEALLNREPLLCIAAVKALRARQVPLPDDVIVVEEMAEPLTVDDWLVLLESFSLRVLKVSPDPALQALYKELRASLLAFGITISEAGIRHGRSPGDLVLALSEAKDAAVVEILRTEAEAMGERLRAVVITDFERLSARTRRLKDVLDPDAGSAVRIYRRIIADPETNALDPILVTGKVVLVDADSREKVAEGLRRWSEGRDVTFSWDWQPTDDPRIVQLVGSGPDWSTRTYVAVVTALFEAGLTRCLVGTRGLFGEGWDALSLNTLLDLTSVTTRTGVQQLRGRSLRLDPAWPRKVAHNWDVVCVSRKFDKGDADLARFVARHAHTWGVVVQSRAQAVTQAVGQALAAEIPDAPLRGRVVRGVPHIDMDLATDLAVHGFKRINFGKYTTRMLNATREREQVYDLWQVGEPYSNFSYSATRVEKEDIKFRTAYTVQDSLRAMVWRLLVSLLAVLGTVWMNGAVLLPWSEEAGAPALLICLGGLTGIAVLVTLVVNAVGIWRVFKRAFLELPADAVLLDMGRALLAALREAGLVSRNLSEKYVRVVETADKGYEVLLDYAAPEESDLFARAYREMMGPLGDARYLIERDSASLRNLIYRPLWLFVRTVLRLGEDLRAYHRVPDVLAARRIPGKVLAALCGRGPAGVHAEP